MAYRSDEDTVLACEKLGAPEEATDSWRTVTTLGDESPVKGSRKECTECYQNWWRRVPDAWVWGSTGDAKVMPGRRTGVGQGKRRWTSQVAESHGRVCALRAQGLRSTVTQSVGL